MNKRDSITSNLANNSSNGFCFGFDSSRCKECLGKCCVGESGYIFVSISEMQDISDFMGLSLEEFALKYVKKVGYRFSLIEIPSKHNAGARKEYACVFFDEHNGSCLIYDVRPKQCRSFPFWESFRGKNIAELSELFKLCSGVRLESKQSNANLENTNIDNVDNVLLEKI